MTARMNPVLGVWRVARGRADGMLGFGATTHSFLTSLAPLIAFPLVGSLLVLVREGMLPALSLLGMTVVAQLAPPVLSHGLARWWGREHLWLHYATAYNWCYWAIPIVASVLTTLFGTGLREGLFLALAAYSLWLHWFIARHGLALNRWRAALLVALVNGGTLILAFGPVLLS